MLDYRIRANAYAHRGELCLTAPLGASGQRPPAQVPPRRSRVALIQRDMRREAKR